MPKSLRSMPMAFVAALVLFALSPVSSVHALSMLHAKPLPLEATTANILKVQSRKRRRRRIGRNIGIGVGAAIIGGIIANEAAKARQREYEERRDRQVDAEIRCEETFRSYDPNTGTYIGYDGIERPCPYL